ncbi:MAG: ArsR/SmtB family transcription factor [Flavobacteriaceae bacterium]
MRRDVFQAIADPVRRDIIKLVSSAPLSVNDVAGHFDISRPAISKHLKILEECGMVLLERRGRERYCIIRPQSLLPAFMWIEQYQNLWEERLDSLGTYLEKLQSNNNTNG